MNLFIYIKLIKKKVELDDCMGNNLPVRKVVIGVMAESMPNCKT